MANLLRTIEGGGFIFWCLGCKEYHQINTDEKIKWDFNGDMEKPTFSPSYLTWRDPKPDVDPKYDKDGKYRNGFRCHSYITDGKIQYLSDCTHELAGQTVDMIEGDY